MNKLSVAFCSMALLIFSLSAQDSVFYWDMEAEKPNLSVGDSTPSYYADARRSREHAYQGSWSLRIANQWAAAMIDNPTDNVVWSPVTEGTIELYWKYVAPWGARMIFQMTGKTSNKPLDTNDGISLRTRGQTVGQFESGMCFDSCKASVSVRTQTITPVDGKWYRFRVKYRTSGSPTYSVQIDELPPVTSNAPIGKTACKAWHQILIGNDLNTTGLQYIDNFKIWPTWKEDIPSKPTGSIRRGQLRMRPNSPSTLPSLLQFVRCRESKVRSLLIYDARGRVVSRTKDFGPGPMDGISKNVSQAPGIYSFLIETETEMVSGALIPVLRMQ